MLDESSSNARYASIYKATKKLQNTPSFSITFLRYYN